MTVKDSHKLRQQTTHTFNIEYKSITDDTTYIGTFTAKKLNIKDLSALGVRKAQLNGGLYYDPENIGRGIDVDTSNFNNMIAHLELALIKVPSWWDFDNISDIGLIGKVFQEVLLFENSFLRQNRETNQAAAGANANANSQGNSGANTPSANVSGVAAALVDEKVQSSLEP